MFWMKMFRRGKILYKQKEQFGWRETFVPTVGILTAFRSEKFGNTWKKYFFVCVCRHKSLSHWLMFACSFDLHTLSLFHFDISPCPCFLLFHVICVILVKALNPFQIAHTVWLQIQKHYTPVLFVFSVISHSILFFYP